VRTRITAIVSLLLLLTVPGHSSADIEGRLDDTENGIVISADVYGAAGGGDGGASSGFEYSVTQRPCTYRIFDAEGDPRCQAATCPDKPADDAENQWRYAEVKRRLAGSGEAWTLIGTSCLNFAVLAPQVTPEMAREQFLQLLPVPTHSFQPAAESVVNLPVIVYTDPNRERIFPPVDLLGQSVLIRSTATTYTWTFGGTEVVTDWPGRPFANDCERLPCDGYVSYPFPAPGTFEIGLTVTWTGEFSVNGGAWQEIPGVGTTESAPQPVTILEARPVLTNPYD